MNQIKNSRNYFHLDLVFKLLLIRVNFAAIKREEPLALRLAGRGKLLNWPVKINKIKFYLFFFFNVTLKRLLIYLAKNNI